MEDDSLCEGVTVADMVGDPDVVGEPDLVIDGEGEKLGAAGGDADGVRVRVGVGVLETPAPQVSEITKSPVV